jgi:hypothetical protein
MKKKNIESEIYGGDDLSNLPPADISKFHQLATADIIKILEPTIKKDDTNKLLVFLAMLNTYTEENQMNVAFIAPSSSGKSYIPLEVSTLFPEEDLIKLGCASPTAFYHDNGTYDKVTNTITINLERKIIIFLDQPNTELLARLRATLSHDEKEIKSKITDKTQKNGTRTKNITLRGFSTFIFCTAGLRVDEQESTRFLLLSPEIDQEKLREAVLQKILKSSDGKAFKKHVNSDPERQLLIQRIKAIKEAHVVDITIKNKKLIEDLFFERVRKLQPRHQRDISKIINIAKSLALLNLWFRENDGLSIVTTDADIQEAFKIWDTFSEAQERNLPPYIFDTYKEVIITEYNRRNPQSLLVPVGLTRGNICTAHYDVYGRYISDWVLRQMLSMLETAGLIYQESDPSDKRKVLIFPISGRTSETVNNSVGKGGVTPDLDNTGEDLLSVFDGKLP